MGLLDFIFGKKKQKGNRHDAPVASIAPKNNEKKEEAPFKKENFHKAIKTIARMSYLFRDSSTLKSTGHGRNTKMMTTLHSYAGMLGYLYEFVYKFGEYAELVDEDMNVHYALVVMAMSDKSHRDSSINQLANNWSDVLQTVLYLQMDGTNEGRQMKAMQEDIDFVTNVIETLSGSKCRKPENKLADIVDKQRSNSVSKDKYSKMVEESSYNPFKITTNPALQNSPALPNYVDVFKRELSNTYSNPLIRQNMDDATILVGYVFNMVESYFKNAGYVPKNTVDAIIEQCYTALKQTVYGSSIGSLDDIKYRIYYGFLHK